MKYSNWASRLDAFISKSMGISFEWDMNCALWACDCVEVQTGKDPAVWFRGKCKDKKSSFASLRKFMKKGDLEKVILKLAKDCGYEEIHINMAQRGDLVMIKDEHTDGLGLGIVSLDGKSVYFMDQTYEGLRRELIHKTHPDVSYSKAWRIE